ANAPQMQLRAQRLEDVFREVKRADGNAAARQEKITGLALLEASRVRGGVVGNDAEIDDVSAGRDDRSRDRVTVRGHDAVAAAHGLELIDVDQLVAGREHRDAGTPMHG